MPCAAVYCAGEEGIEVDIVVELVVGGISLGRTNFSWNFDFEMQTIRTPNPGPSEKKTLRRGKMIFRNLKLKKIA